MIMENENTLDINDELNRTISEKENVIINKKQLYFSELEMNTEFDESISFSHFFSVYKEFESDEDYINPQHKKPFFPFLTNIDFVYSFFESKKESKEVKETPISIKARIKEFSTSHDEIYKNDFLSKLKTYSEIIGIETTSFLLIPVLAKIVDDTQTIKKQFLSVLPDFIGFLGTFGDQGYNIIKTNILGIIDEIYHNEKFGTETGDLEELLQNNLITISQALTPKDKEECILTLILSFANNEIKIQYNNDDIDNKKKICVGLMASLAEDLGKDITENVILPQISSFSDDEDTELRFKVVDIIPKLTKCISPEVIHTRLYEIIKRLANDANFQVRKRTAKVIPEVVKINKEKCLFSHVASKNIIFVEIVEKFIVDNHSDVRMAVLEVIGPLIAPLDREELSSKLFTFYKNTLEEFYFNLRDKIIENKSFSSVNYSQMLINSAYNFPAVLYCYGQSYWDQLRKAYLNLCGEKSLAIRKSIIDSFHEICAILGKEITETELLPIYDRFLESTVKEEKQYALRNLPKIIKNVSKDIKEKYFKYIDPVVLFQKEDNKLRNFKFSNWRNKLDVVESVLCYFNLYDNEVIYSSIFPQCIMFCLDDFYKVRSVSAKVLGNLISYLYTNNYNKEKLIQLVETFAYSKNFHHRISFVKMCKIFLMNYSMYKDVIGKILGKVINDKNLSVKIACSKMLRSVVKNEKCPCHNDKNIYSMCTILIQNNSKSIRDLLEDIKNIIVSNEVINKDEMNSNNFTTFQGNLDFLKEEFQIDFSSSKTNNANTNSSNEGI